MTFDLLKRGARVRGLLSDRSSKFDQLEGRGRAGQVLLEAGFRVQNIPALVYPRAIRI